MVSAFIKQVVLRYTCWWMSGMDTEASTSSDENSEDVHDIFTKLLNESRMIGQGCSQHNENRVGDETSELVNRLTSIDISLETDKPMAVDRIQSEKSDFLELQEASNILRAAFKELLTIAQEAKTWVVCTPAFGAIEEFIQIFRRPTLPGMRIEYSIESAAVPISPSRLVSGMMDGDIWATTLSHIVYHGSIHDLTGALSGLKSCGGLGNVKLVNAELHLPTPFMPTRKLCFLRCEREITQNVWAIVDVSCDYFQSRPLEQEAKCLRRPSGVIIRAHDQYSEVIWIENVEVQECQLQENMYSTIINSNLAFCAKRWISTLLQKIGRKCSRFLNLKMLIGMKASDNLLNLADCLEKVYFECINYIPDQSNWELVSDEKVRILKDKRVDCADNLNPNSYIAVSSFHVQARPLVLFNFLAKKNMEFQWLSLPTLEEPEELINFATEDDSNRITLHHKINEYFLQEVSKNEFCSFIISSPMTETVVNESLTFRQLSNSSLKPSGFTIMPDGSGGLQSGASLLTICVQEELYSLETDLVIEVMNSRINDILSRINEAGNEA